MIVSGTSLHCAPNRRPLSHRPIPPLLWCGVVYSMILNEKLLWQHICFRYPSLWSFALLCWSHWFLLCTESSRSSVCPLLIADIVSGFATLSICATECCRMTGSCLWVLWRLRAHYCSTGQKEDVHPRRASLSSTACLKIGGAATHAYIQLYQSSCFCR